MDDHKQENGLEGSLIDLGEIKGQPSMKPAKEVTSTSDLDSDFLIGGQDESAPYTRNGNGTLQEMETENGVDENHEEKIFKFDEFDPLAASTEIPKTVTYDETGSHVNPLNVAFLEREVTSPKVDPIQEHAPEQSKMADSITTPEVSTPGMSTSEVFTSGLPTPVTPGVSTGTFASPVKAKPPASSPTKVPKLVSTNGERGQTARPKSGTNRIKAATPTSQKPTGIPGCQRAVSVDRTKSSLSSPRTPSNTPVGALDLLKLKSPADDCGGSTASTPRSSLSQKGSIQSQVKPKVGSLENAKHVPGGGNVTIMSQKLDFSQVTSRCGSKDNMKHTPKGGDKKVESRKLEWKAESKIGSLENAKHKPGGGVKKIESAKLEWKVTSKVGSLENAQHVPGGGAKKIDSLKLDFKEKAQAKVGSKDNIGHKPGGGTKKIESQKLSFKETAQPRIDASLKTPGKAEEKEALEQPAE